MYSPGASSRNQTRQRAPPLLLGVLDDVHLILRGFNLEGSNSVSLSWWVMSGTSNLSSGMYLSRGRPCGRNNLSLEILVADVHEVGPLGGIDEVLCAVKSGRIGQNAFKNHHGGGEYRIVGRECVDRGGAGGAGGYLVLASERGGDGGDVEVRAGVESLDGGGPVLLEEGADDANLGGVIDDVGKEGVEVVAGALVLVGVVEDLLRVELPELAARDGEGEGFDGSSRALPRAAPLGTSLLVMNCMGMWYSSANLAATDSVSRLPGLAESLCEEGAPRRARGRSSGGLGSARDRAGVGMWMARRRRWRPRR